MTAAALLALPFGLAAGSAAGAALVRWPAGRTLSRPARSVCDACGVRLSALDVLPALGILRCRGRCRGCGARVAIGPVLLEAACGGVVALAWTAQPPRTAAILGAVGVGVMLAAALDRAHGWIPDRLTLPLASLVLPVALAEAAARGADATPVLLHGLGLPVLLETLRRLSRRGARGPWIGGGDVKLLVAVGAAAALVPAGPTLLWGGALVAAGAVALAGLASGRLERGSALPFAPFLALGWTAMLVVAPVVAP